MNEPARFCVMPAHGLASRGSIACSGARIAVPAMYSQYMVVDMYMRERSGRQLCESSGLNECQPGAMNGRGDGGVGGSRVQL